MKPKKVKVPMKFNAGLQKYEPSIPDSKEKGKKIKFKDIWQVLIVVLMAIALLVGFSLLIK